MSNLQEIHGFALNILPCTKRCDGTLLSLFSCRQLKVPLHYTIISSLSYFFIEINFVHVPK